MNNFNSNDFDARNQYNKDLIAACGLYCGACGIYLATQENDTETILQYAVVLNQSYNETMCHGCGAEIKSLHCSKICVFIECKKGKGVSFCTDCDEFPCMALIDFKSKKPHRVEIIEMMNKLKEIGSKKWLLEMKNYFSCPRCKTVNSAYHLACRKCGNTISCKFVSKYGDLINQYLSK